MTCTQADELALRVAVGPANPADQSRLDEHLHACPACRAAHEMIRTARIVPKHELEGRALRGAMSHIQSERDSVAAAKLEKFDRFGILNIAALAATILIIIVTIHNYSIKPAQRREAADNDSNSSMPREKRAVPADTDSALTDLNSEVHPLLNKLAPCPKLNLFDGGKFDLARHQGREVVVLHFRSDGYYSFGFVTALAKVFEEYQGKGVVAYDVCGKCDAEHLKRYAQDHASFLLKHVIVDGGQMMSSLYQVGGCPQLFIIGRNGKVQWTHLGADDAIGTTLPAALDKILAEPALNDPQHELIDAVEAQDLAQMQAALEHGVDVNAQDDWGATALMRATWLNSKRMADVLIEKGANVNIRDRQNWTALMFAAENGAAGIADRLLKAGADPDVKNNSGQRAASLAILNGHPQIADILSGPDSAGSVESVDVFLKAVEREQVPVVEMLIAHGAKVNACNDKGENALSIAIRSGKAQMVKLLLDAKADPNAITVAKSPLEQARKMKNEEIIDLLVKAGAK